MNWESFYLVCFVAGFALAVLSFVGGVLHLPHLHLPGFHGHPAHIGGAHAAGGSDGAPSLSPLNFGTAMAFLAWFGAMGYLLTTRAGLGKALVLALSSAAGLAGAGVVFLFVTRVLLSHERPLDAADFEMVGVLGRVTVTIRAGGTGEIVYSQAGTRRSAGARSDSGGPVPRGAEVIVTRYEGGIAYVRPWEELAESRPASPRAELTSDRNSPVS
jgi:membrane protein implicated in regulation of membrane protease activity